MEICKNCGGTGLRQIAPNVKGVMECECQMTRKQEECTHPDAYVQREGMTGMCGTVICPACGFERDWNAY